MGAGVISFFIAVGATMWLYGKLQKYSGNNTKQSAIAAGIAGVVLFIIIYYVMHLILK